MDQPRSSRLTRGFRRWYGRGPLHLLTLLCCFALVGYVLTLFGPSALWNHEVWWQSVLVWFVGAIVAHDLLLFPLYALADRSLTSGWAVIVRRRRWMPPAEVSPVNYVRVPFLATALTLALFFPGIIRQGADTYAAATGQSQDPFLTRWLLLTAVFFGGAALAYALRIAWWRGRRPAGEQRRTYTAVERRH